MSEAKVCTNCKSTISENYCSNCGQQALGKKATTLNLLSDSISNLFYLEKSVFGTILKLLLDPKPIIENYYQGFRNFYASPGKLLLYSIAVIALHINFINPNVLGMVINVDNISTQYFFWIMHLPIVLLISYLAFLTKKEDLSKHIISIVYISCSALMVFTVINDFIIITVGDVLGNLAFIVFILFTFIWNSRVFSRADKKFHYVLNTFLQLLIYVAIVAILAFASNSITLN